jgi:hypothetical protein
MGAAPSLADPIMTSTAAAWVLFSGVILGLYAAVVASLNTSGRAALNSPSGTPIYAQTCHDAGFDPLNDKDAS